MAYLECGNPSKQLVGGNPCISVKAIRRQQSLHATDCNTLPRQTKQTENCLRHVCRSAASLASACCAAEPDSLSSSQRRRVLRYKGADPCGCDGHLRDSDRPDICHQVHSLLLRPMHCPVACRAINLREFMDCRNCSRMRPSPGAQQYAR